MKSRLGVEIGEEVVRAVLVDEEGHVVDAVSIPLEAGLAPHQALASLVERWPKARSIVIAVGTGASQTRRLPDRPPAEADALLGLLESNKTAFFVDAPNGLAVVGAFNGDGERWGAAIDGGLVERLAESLGRSGRYSWLTTTPTVLADSLGDGHLEWVDGPASFSLEAAEGRLVRLRRGSEVAPSTTADQAGPAVGELGLEFTAALAAARLDPAASLARRVDEISPVPTIPLDRRVIFPSLVAAIGLAMFLTSPLLDLRRSRQLRAEIEAFRPDHWAAADSIHSRAERVNTLLGHLGAVEQQPPRALSLLSTLAEALPTGALLSRFVLEGGAVEITILAERTDVAVAAITEAFGANRVAQVGGVERVNGPRGALNRVIVRIAVPAEMVRGGRDT